VWEYLSRQDPESIRRRIGQLESSGDPNARPVAEALREQLDALGALDAQLDRFHAQMEHIVASLQTMHAHLLRMSVASEAEDERRLATQARELRGEVNALVGEERVIAFDQPGTTRDPIAVPFERAGRSWTSPRGGRCTSPGPRPGAG
jgi:hypothetical protein